LFLPPFRRWAAGALAKAAAARKRAHGQRDRIIDLEPGEWHQIEDQKRRRRAKSGRRN
jgi:hypothetical protein